MGTTVDAVMNQIAAQAALESIGSFLGRGNEGKAAVSAQATLAALIGAFTHRTASPRGSEVLFALVEGDDGSALEDIRATLEQGRHGLHGAVVGALLGSSRQTVEAGVADHCGISLDAAAALLPRLLPLVVSGLSRHVSTQRLDRSGFTEMLMNDRETLLASGFRGVISLVGSHLDDEVEFAGALASALALGGPIGWGSAVTSIAAPCEMDPFDPTSVPARSTSMAEESGRWRRFTRSMSAPFKRGRTSRLV